MYRNNHIIRVVRHIVDINADIVKELGKNAGADVIGIASADCFVNSQEGFRPVDKLASCRSVIVLGCPFPQEAIFKSTAEYTAIRNLIVKKMDEMAKTLARQIKKLGYETKAIGGLGGKRVNGHFYGHISLKHAAELAGIGKISRNYLLTNPEYGNMLWFTAVLTSAELTPDSLALYDVCGSCNKCVEVCPSGALNDAGLFGQKKCYQTCYKTVKGKLELKCFQCRKVCPYRFGSNQFTDIPHISV